MDRLHLILQIPGKPKEDEPNPLEGLMPRVTADEDARLMIAANESGVPAPKVRAILGSPPMVSDPGYITSSSLERRLGNQDLREEKFAECARRDDGAMR